MNERHWNERHWNEHHWNDDRLIDHLYGIAPADAHLESCGECAARRDAVRLARRSAVSAESEVAADFLAAQRRRIEARIERPREWSFGLPQALSVAVTVLMAVLLSMPVPEPEPTVASSGSVVSLDAQLFAEISELVENAEPRAAAPIHGLFSEGLP